MALQGIRRIAPGIVQDLAINSGRPSTLPVGCCWGDEQRGRRQDE